MKVFICRWQNGDLSIVGARDPEDAVSILDEVEDATDAELFEIKDLLINFQLDHNGHLELEEFGEALDGLIWEKAYPLLFQARMHNDNDETDFLEALDAERARLWPKDDIRETDYLARNLYLARVASDRNISLASALKTIKAETLPLNESWHTLAVKCQVFNSAHDNHITGMAALSDGPCLNLRMSTVPQEELKPYDQNDLLPHFLLAAVHAERLGASILMAWPYVRPHLKKEIGTYWRWLAQAVRDLPTSN
jgi:hypothetical protein